MPGGAASVPRVDLDGLIVPAVSAVISAAVAQVNSTHECNVAPGRRRVSNEHELLMVRSAPAHPLVE
jgi:hypothetical protein